MVAVAAPELAEGIVVLSGLPVAFTTSWPRGCNTNTPFPPVPWAGDYQEVVFCAGRGERGGRAWPIAGWAAVLHALWGALGALGLRQAPEAPWRRWHGRGAEAPPGTLPVLQVCPRGAPGLVPATAEGHRPGGGRGACRQGVRRWPQEDRQLPRLPPTTVRGWVRAATSAASYVARVALQVAFTADARLDSVAPRPTPLASAMEALGLAASALVRALGPVAEPWDIVVAVSGGRLLGPVPPG